MKIARFGLPAMLFSVSSVASSYHHIAELDSVVTTGTRTAKSLHDSPVAVEIISSDELKMVTSGTLAQAMEYIPGVSVTRSAKYGYNVSMMGFDSDKVLILLDGQRLISTTNDGVDLDQLSASNIDRIEIIRGPASVLYGSSAMGGVINVITKPIDDNQTKLSYEVASYGENEFNGESHNVNASHSFISGNSKVRFSLQYLDDPGFEYDHSTENKDGTATEKLFLDAKLSHQFNQLNASYHPQVLQEERFNEDDDKLKPGLGLFEDGYRSEINRVVHDVAIDHSEQGWQVRARHANHNESSGREVGLTRDATYQIQNVDAQKVFSIWDSQLVTGVLWDKEYLNSPEDTVLHKTAYNREAFGQWDYLLSDDIEILAGIRTQDSDRFGGKTTSRLSTRLTQAFDSGRLTIRAGVAESYKVPTLKHQYYVFDHSAVGYIVLGDEELDPESAVSKTLSLTYDWHDGHQLSISAHQSQVENLIQTFLQEEQEGIDIYVYDNVAKARIAGFDMSWEHLLSDSLHYGLNYSYVDKRQANGERIHYVPRHQIKAKAGWHHYPSRMQFLMYAVHQSDIAVDESQHSQIKNDNWTTLNLSMRHSVTNSISWRAAIENVLDEHKDTQLPEDEYDARAIDSRKIVFGMTYEF